MKLTKTALAVSLLPLVIGLLPCNARATQWDKLSIITFSNPVAIPGRVLPAGTYRFKLVDLESSRNVVRIFSKDESQLFATFAAIRIARIQPADKTVIKFKEQPADKPQAIQVWYYPNDLNGLEFVYS
jgi:hypothetical protein